MAFQVKWATRCNISDCRKKLEEGDWAKYIDDEICCSSHHSDEHPGEPIEFIRRGSVCTECNLEHAGECD